MRPLLAALLLLPVPAAARPVQFAIHTFEGVGDADYREVVDGVQRFAALAQRHCGVAIAPSFSRARRGAPGDWLFDYSWTPLPVGAGRSFMMHEYQAGVYALTKRENLPAVPGQIDLFVRHTWREGCGTSFPRVQFLGPVGQAQAANLPLQAEVVPWMMNRILLVSRSGMGDCGSDYGRIVAHELGHLFTQDDPPHRCPLADGRIVPCDGSNLLAYEIEGGGRDNVLYVRLATGTELSATQCGRLRDGLDRIWDAP